MPHDDRSDHPTKEGLPQPGHAAHAHEVVSHTEGLSASPTLGGAGLVPMAEAITIDDGTPGGTVALTPNPEGPGTLPGVPQLPQGTIPQLPQLPQLPGPQLTFPKYCNLSLPAIGSPSGRRRASSSIAARCASIAPAPHPWSAAISIASCCFRR
jgi:hypothetical protein